ncbi:MAG TPA: hypothetical protein VE032_02295 [Actinomycetota bacterium]|nr:hypothetical protein [Actinomycetota bacterium]
MHDRQVRTTIVRVLVATAVAGGGLVGLTAGRAAGDAWSNDNCRVGWSFPTFWKRSNAASYTQPPLREGYSLNGGCYRLNDRDDTPGLPADGGGEGTDCSGFVFRAWALKTDGSNGYKRWDYQHDVHGPYYSWDFKDPEDGEPFKNIPKGDLSIERMDAIAWYRDGGDDRHIALMWSEGDRADYFVHAHTNTAGVEISEEIYRQLSDTEGVQRKNWSPECEPKCPGPGTRAVP